MPTCQLCGEDTESTEKAKIEGAVLKVCSSCADMGEKIETNSKKSKKKNTKRKKRSRSEQKVLTNNYGEKIRDERENRELTMEELSDQMNEKTSVIQKVEREELKPDKSLAGKLSKKLGIDLYVNPKVTEYDDTGDGDTRSATLGDVAEIKD